MAYPHPSDAPSHRRGSVRALVPLSVIAAVGVGSAIVPGLASAAPALPAISAQNLLVKVAQSKADAFTGTVSVTTNLGLPALPDLGQGTNPLTLLTGSHTLVVAANGPTRQRVALLGQMSEYDLVHNGTKLWFYDSSQNAVQYATATGNTAHDKKTASASGDTAIPLTPQQAATRLLAAVDPTTAISVDGTRTVAGQAAYTLVLTPKQHGSLIGRIEIAVDAANGAPLRVALYPAGSSTAAFDIAFTQVSFSAPSDARFQFTPPAGASVTPLTNSGTSKGTKTTTQDTPPQVLGANWLSVVEVHGVNLSSLSKSSSDSSSNATGLFNGNVNSYLQALNGAGTTVHGAFGTGTLYTTNLLSVLITNDGRMFVGAVTPTVLRADANAQGTR
jgi:outer membrane lipoprotein-sorting protein